ncbi:hypothetical protein IAQ61_008796, partial [Plenodomus lingam]|uniref:RBR-type E3 ubiquitin transferase n=1 Tax=Leptosphaeria maculans (strain JN3 / isolate v23.1.3 / race Av1-4-5-6-7-8) TaxID=985895 RepID=E4ZNL1_LEPMJ
MSYILRFLNLATLRTFLSMARIPNICVICEDAESFDCKLALAPCGRHWICSNDLTAFYILATRDESQYPPKCCGHVFHIKDYEHCVEHDTAEAFTEKEAEYKVLARNRVYCANTSCARFLDPRTHIQCPTSGVAYAVCHDGDACDKLTCTKCKTLINGKANEHACSDDEDAAEMEKAIRENKFQQCYACHTIIELREGCNHIQCHCGHEICYICGRPWTGHHGCPSHTAASYDADGYNQNGFHRDTGLHRSGLAYAQYMSSISGHGELEEGEIYESDGEAEPAEVLQQLHIGDVEQRKGDRGDDDDDDGSEDVESGPVGQSGLSWWGWGYR